MRINVYSQELTAEVKHLRKESDGKHVTGFLCLPNGDIIEGRARETLPAFLVEVWEKRGRPDSIDSTNPYKGIREEPIVYHAAQLMLHSSPMLHHPPMDDDRSAVTFWLPKSKNRREEMAQAFEMIARIFREAPPEGMD